jgi:hypothetical protein
MENGFHFNFSGNPVVFFFFLRRAGPNIDRKTFIIGKDGSIKAQPRQIPGSIATDRFTSYDSNRVVPVVPQLYPLVN